MSKTYKCDRGTQAPHLMLQWARVRVAWSREEDVGDLGMQEG